MDHDSATPALPGESGSPPSDPGDDQESASPVGDMFEEGETDVGPHPSLINLKNWESSDLASSASAEGTEPEGEATDE